MGRILKEQPAQPTPDESQPAVSEHKPEDGPRGEDATADVSAEAKPEREIRSRHPNHIWHIDLTVVPIGPGMTMPWWPFAYPQCWPFCWWIIAVVVA